MKKKWILLSLIIMIIFSIFSGCKSKKIDYTMVDFPKQITEFTYSNIKMGRNGYFLATKHGKSVALDINGKEYTDKAKINLAKCNYYLDTLDGVSYYGDDNSIAFSHRIVDQNGKKIPCIKIPKGWKLTNDEYYFNDQDIVPARNNKYIYKNNNMGYINKYTGEIVINNQYAEAGPFENGIACVVYRDADPGSEKTYINEAGEEIKPIVTGNYDTELSDEDFAGGSYSELAIDYKVPGYEGGILPQIVRLGKYYSNDGILGINERKRTRYVFKDVNGNAINDTEFSETTGFSDGTAVLSIPGENHWSIMDLNGNIKKTEIQKSDWIYVEYIHSLNCYYFKNSNDDTNGIYVDHDGKKLSKNECKKMELCKSILDNNSDYDAVKYIKINNINPFINTLGLSKLKRMMMSDSASYEVDEKGVTINYKTNCYYYSFLLSKVFHCQNDDNERELMKVHLADSEYVYTNKGIYNWNGDLVSDKSDGYLINGKFYNVKLEFTGLGYQNSDGKYITYPCDSVEYLGDGIFIAKKSVNSDGNRMKYKCAMVSLK